VILALPDLGGVRQRLARAAAGWVGAAAGLEAASVIAFAVAFHRTFASELSWWNSASLATAAQGVNVLVPAGGTGGLAATVVVMVRFGMSRDYVIRRMLAVFVIADALTNVAMVIIGGFGVATGALPGHASWAFTLLPALLASLLCAAVVAVAQRAPGARPAPAGRLRRLARSGADRVRDGLRASSELLRTGDPLLVFGAAGSVLLDLGALAAAFAAIGSRGLSLGPMMLAYTLGQIGSVVSLPGTTEGGLLGVFVLYGAPLGAAASAIIVYRAVQIFIPLGLGLVGAMGVRAMLGDGFSPHGGDLTPEGPTGLSGPR
jgi:uncharacterized membrane protein YbhN (UPF0104 family)